MFKKVDQILANYIGTGSNWIKAVVGLTAPAKTITRSLLDFLSKEASKAFLDYTLSGRQRYMEPESS